MTIRHSRTTLSESLSYKYVSAASTNAVIVSSSPNAVMSGFYMYNSNASVRYVKLYNLLNQTTAPTSSDKPVMTIGVPPSRSAALSFPSGVLFPGGIGMRIVTGAADSDNTAVAANEVTVNLTLRVR